MINSFFLNILTVCYYYNIYIDVVLKNCYSRRDNSYMYLFVIILENRKLGISPITR